MAANAIRLVVGCGYLGRRVARRWVTAGDTVYALTRSTQHAAELSTSGIRPILGDVLDPTSLRDLPPATTVVYAVGYDRSARASKRDVYVDGLRNVLTAIPSTVDRFVYVSSTSVYGQSQGEWVDETSECRPRSEGGLICLEAELLLQESWGNRGALAILRSSGLYGPGRLLVRIESLTEQKPLPGPAEGWLNLVHVEDAASAVITCVDRPDSGDQLFILTDDEPIQRKTYYGLLSSLAQTSPPVFEAASSSTLELGKRCRNQRMREMLGVSLQYPTIREGLPNAVSPRE